MAEEGIASKEFAKRLFEYIAFLEKTNDELVVTLKHCSKILEEVKILVPDPQGWQQLLDELQRAIKAGERTVDKSILH